MTRADEAVDRLLALGWPEELRTLVKPARARVRNGRMPPRPVDDRALQRQAREKRE